jgi:hypothetical protein
LQSTNHAYPGSNAFVAKFNPSGSALVYSTYLGGNANSSAYGDFGQGIAADSAGDAYITGWTYSSDFPTMNPLQPTNRAYPSSNAFVAKFNPSGSAMVYSTYLGGSGGDTGGGIAVDSDGDAYVSGTTGSYDFPTKNPLQPVSGGVRDAFVAKLDPSGTALVYSTYLGGSQDEYGHGVAVDSAGNAYVTGTTYSTDFPVVSAFQPANRGSNDVFVAKLNPAGSALVYSTFLGGSGVDWGYGIAVDSMGNVYVNGYTGSTDFPTVNPLQSANGGGYDALVAKISPPATIPCTITLSSSPDPSAYGQSVTFTAAASSQSGTPTGYVYFLNGKTLLSLLPLSGGAASLSTATLPLGINGITADYGGDSNFATSTSNTVNQTVKGTGTAVTTTTLSSGPNPSVVGQGVTLTVVVAPAPSGGAVTFMSGSTILGTGTVYSNQASFTTSALPEGIDSLIAMYSGDSNYAGSTSKTANQEVKGTGKTRTTTTLSSSANPSAYGQVVNFAAVVAFGEVHPPDGQTVWFTKGTTVLGTGTLSGGSASLTTSALPLGNNGVQAAYFGDSQFASSKSSTVTQVVSKATTTTALTSSLNPSNYKQSVTFTATVAPQFSQTPTGTVVFKDGVTTLKSVALSGGSASYATTRLARGRHNITATYNGSTDFGSSSGSLSQTVN